MNKLFYTAGLLMVGAGLGWTFTRLVMPQNMANEASADSNEPLYWVAPMDANFKRDEPGLSPMGMELVPVYESGASEKAGQVFIAPNVVNNLGVRSALVTNKVLNNTVNTIGYVQYDQEQVVHIHPRVSGWLNKLHIKTSGERVTKGQALYDIYSPALVNAQEELLLGLNRQNKRLITAAKARLQSLLVPQVIIDKVVSSNRVQQNITIYAPQSGVIDDLSVREGFYVQPGTRIMSIATLDQVWVNVKVFERQSGAVSTGDNVTMTLDYWPGEMWQGQVDYIYPTLDETTRTQPIRLRFDNLEHKLKPNMFAKVNIESHDEISSILVPREAVIRTGQSSRVVMDLGDGNYKSVNVTLGRSNDEAFEVLSGLEEGDNVVISAQFLIDSESSVSSDFMRIDNDDAAMPMSMGQQPVVIDVMIEGVMVVDNQVKLTHPPIEAWDWPEMTMNFSVANDIKLTEFSIGTRLKVELVNDAEQGYMVNKILTDMNNNQHSSMKSE